MGRVSDSCVGGLSLCFASLGNTAVNQLALVGN